MSVALLLITHAPMGSTLLGVLRNTLQEMPLPIATIDIVLDSDPQQAYEQAAAQLEALQQGDGVLLITDLYGATPSNIANRLLAEGENLRLLSGLNLPMLLRTMNYAGLPLEELAQKALDGGRDGILLLPAVAPEEQLNHA